MGLARAFLASGAGSVVATQWPVGPSTRAPQRSRHCTSFLLGGIRAGSREVVGPTHRNFALPPYIRE